MTDNDKEYREEAERLAALPQDQRREILRIIAEPANNAQLDETIRNEALARVEAIKKHLKRLSRKKK